MLYKTRYLKEIQNINNRNYKYKIAFKIAFKLFKYIVIPFILTNTLVTSQVVINVVLNKYFSIFILTCLNNILIYTKETLKNYKEKVKLVLAKLKKYSL